MIRGDELTTKITNNKNGQINIILDNHKVTNHLNERNHLFKKNPFSHIDEAFSSIVGMSALKEKIQEIYATIIINKKRSESGLHCQKQVLHMLFKGNPGTGKTTVARKLAKIYQSLNLLSKGHLIEAERADLVGEYIGQTAQKTRAIIQKSLGGILFIDEAYSLARGGEKDFGKEAIDTLVKHMEDHQQDFVLILAGYPNEMEQFLTLNPGLKSRFPFILDFPNYNINQLMEIAKKMVTDREYKLTKEAEWKLKILLSKQIDEERKNFSNGRFVRNVIECAIRNHAVRLLYHTDWTMDDLIYITEEDVIFQDLK